MNIVAVCADICLCQQISSNTLLCSNDLLSKTAAKKTNALCEMSRACRWVQCENKIADKGMSSRLVMALVLSFAHQIFMKLKCTIKDIHMHN